MKSNNLVFLMSQIFKQKLLKTRYRNGQEAYKKFSTSLDSGKMKNKTTMTYHNIPTT